jgi:hypothetical protein
MRSNDTERVDTPNSRLSIEVDLNIEMVRAGAATGWDGSTAAISMWLLAIAVIAQAASLYFGGFLNPLNVSNLTPPNARAARRAIKSPFRIDALVAAVSARFLLPRARPRSGLCFFFCLLTGYGQKHFALSRDALSSLLWRALRSRCFRARAFCNAPP